MLATRYWLQWAAVKKLKPLKMTFYLLALIATICVYCRLKSITV